MSTVSAKERAAIGGAAGMSEVFIMQPIVGLKNALQEGRPLPRSLSHLYRGLGVNVTSMAPITATQFGTLSVSQKLSTSLGVTESSATSKLVCAATAGAVSALVASPAELLVVQQQKSGLSLSNQALALLKRYGPGPMLTRGLGLCVGRETIYAGAYLGLYPVLQSYLQSRPEFERLGEGSATLMGGLVAGLVGSFFSHPFDTLKTRQQAFMYDRKEYLGSASALRSVLGEEGVGALWKGHMPRGFRVVCAVFILNGVGDCLTNKIHEARTADLRWSEIPLRSMP